MNNSQLFKQAHAMAKVTQKNGDCYRVTFGLCLKAIKTKPSACAIVVSKVCAIYLAITKIIMVIIIASPIIAAVVGLMAIDQMKEHNKESFDTLYSSQVQATKTK